MKIVYNTWFPFVDTHGSNEGDALGVLLPVVWG